MNQRRNQWRELKVYAETHQYYDDKGLILGFVRRFKAENPDSWTAHREAGDGPYRIGRYISLETAKAAVEEDSSQYLSRKLAVNDLFFESAETEGL